LLFIDGRIEGGGSRLSARAQADARNYN